MSKILNKVIIGKIMIHKVEKIPIVLHNEKAWKISQLEFSFQSFGRPWRGLSLVEGYLIHYVGPTL